MTAIPTDLAAAIPRDWTVSELGEAAHLKNGSAFKPDDWKTTGVPIVRIQNLKDRNAAFNYFQGNPDLEVPLKNGDLVFSWSGSIGTSFGPHYWWGDVAVLNQHIFRVDLKPETKLTKPFLYYALLHLTKEIESHAYGLAALVHVRKGDLEATRVPVPTGPEQWKIAVVLGLVQRAIEQQEQLVALTTELKKSLMHKLFTKGLHGEPQKKTEIGPVPESWKVVPLGTLAKIGNGSTPKRNNKSYWDRGFIPWLTSAKIHERFITEADEFVTELAAKECHLPRVKPRSLLIAITGQGKTLGSSALVYLETCISQHLAYAAFHASDVVPEFLLWYFQTRYQHLRSVSQAGGSTKGALTCGYLKTYPVPLPLRDEQREIAEMFAALEKKERIHVRKKRMLTDLFRTLLHQLMTAQIRVRDLDLLFLEQEAVAS
jgi:type I restriction enzyme S subunit